MTVSVVYVHDPMCSWCFEFSHIELVYTDPNLMLEKIDTAARASQKELD